MKIKVSFDGKTNRHFELIEMLDSGRFQVKWQGQVYKGEFVSITEYERYVYGVHFCRAKYEWGDWFKDIYLTKV